MLSSEEFRETIGSLVSNRPTRTHARRFIEQCYRIALAYLRQKQNAGPLNLDLLGLTLENLAMDAVADLFERDDGGRFVALAAYFEPMGYAEADGQALFEATRRLVFSAVNDRLFAGYGEADPSLTNLIRSLKRSIKERPSLVLERRSRALWVTTGAADEIAVLMPPELLEARLTPAIRQGMHTGDVLDAAVRVLRSQTTYTSGYPLTMLAQVIRSATVRVNEATVEPSAAPEALFHEEEVARLIERSVAAIQASMRAGYVGKAKVDEATYAIYFEAIRDRLTEAFARHNDHSLTNYKALCVYLPGLSREAYEKKHRAIFEYLSKRTRERFMNRWKKEL